MSVERSPLPSKKHSIFIAGCAGIPAAYGGFETLAENLVLYREKHGLNVEITVFCSRHNVEDPADVPPSYHGSR